MALMMRELKELANRSRRNLRLQKALPLTKFRRVSNECALDGRAFSSNELRVVREGNTFKCLFDKNFKKLFFVYILQKSILT